MNEWISVKDRLSEDGIEVLTISKGQRIGVCNCVKSYFEKYGNYDEVTHWMPLQIRQRRNKYGD